MPRLLTRVKYRGHDESTSCVSAGETIARPRYSRKRSARRVILNGILAALDKGPGTGAEIQERMGVTYSTSLHSLLHVLEREGSIKRIGHGRIPKVRGPGSRPIRWGLIIATNSENKPQQPQSLDPQHTDQSESECGARR